MVKVIAPLDKDAIGFYIKHYRKKAKITQGELAKRCDLSVSYISNIENKSVSPSLDTINTLFVHLDILPSLCLDILDAEEIG